MADEAVSGWAAECGDWEGIPAEYADPPFATRQDFMKNEGNQYERGRFLKNVTPKPQNITTLGMLERFQNV